MDRIEPNPERAQRTYFTVIAVVATLALAYVAALVLKPELFGTDAHQRAPGGEPQSNQGQRAGVTAEIQAIRRDVAQIKSEVGEIRTGVAANEDRERAMLSRIGSLEQTVTQAGLQRLASSGLAPGGTGGTPSAPPAGAQAVGGALVAGQVVEEGRSPGALAKGTVPAAMPAAPTGTPSAPAGSKAVLPKVAAAAGTLAPAGMSSSIVSSILPAPAGKPAAPALAPGPASAGVPPASAKLAPSGVQLASGPSLDALRLSWTLLNERHRSLLKGLEARFMSPEGAPDVFNLVAGPLSAPEDAGKLCASLKARRIACAVVPFGGQGL